MSDEDKKYDLSGRRRNELLQKGKIARSADISTTVILATAMGLLLWGGGMLLGFVRNLMIKSFGQIGQGTTDFTAETIGSIFTSELWFWLALYLLVIATAVFIAQVAQVGFNFIEDGLTLHWEALNPLNNWSSIINTSKLVQMAQNLVKLTIIGAFTYLAISEIKTSPVFQRPVSMEELGKAYLDVSWALAWRVILALTILAAIDYGYQFWKFNQDNKMTLQEVREESRSTEASPEIIKKRKQKARQLSLKRMLDNLKDATVVITNPTHYAIALKYKKGETDAPIMLAKGTRLNALRIKEEAWDLRIPVRENKPLAQGLYKYGQVNKPIPPAFYQGVAIVLAALYREGFSPTENRPRSPQDNASETDI